MPRDTRTQQERLHNDHKNSGRLERSGSSRTGSSPNDARHATRPDPGVVRRLWGR